MHASRAALAVALLALLPVAGAQEPEPDEPRPPGAGISIGTLAWADRAVERALLPRKSSWRRLAAGDALRTGDTYRTAPDATARLEFPWMAVTLAPSTMLTIPASTVLSTTLEQGRAEFTGPGRDIVKIRVGDGEVRGGGRLVLRRTAGRTTAAALEGAFRVRGARRTVEIRAGQGTVVEDGRPPTPPVALPPPPGDLRPGTDPLYVRSGQPVELRWAPAGPAHHVEVLALEGDEVLMAREASVPPLLLQIPWLGTYRWRVAARDASGLEGRPSAEGLICAVER